MEITVGRRGGATNVGGESLTDGDKVLIQMYLDVKEFRRKGGKVLESVSGGEMLFDEEEGRNLLELVARGEELFSRGA